MKITYTYDSRDHQHMLNYKHVKESLVVLLFLNYLRFPESMNLD